jgi:hypothetical protein
MSVEGVVEQDTGYKRVEALAVRMYGPGTKLAYRTRPGNDAGQWWITDKNGALREASLSLEELETRLQLLLRAKTVPEVKGVEVGSMTKVGAGNYPSNVTRTDKKPAGAIDAIAAARRLRVSSSGVRGFSMDRGLKAFLVSGQTGKGGLKWFFLPADIDAWAAKNTYKHFTPRAAAQPVAAPKAARASLNGKHSKTVSGVLDAHRIPNIPSVREALIVAALEALLSK